MREALKQVSLFAVMIVFHLGYADAALGETGSLRVLKLGVRQDAPPFAFKDRMRREFRGYSVDICKQIGYRALDQGLYDRMDLVAVDVQDRFTKLEDKSIDILCGATTVSLNRIKRFRPTLYTFLSGASFMYKHSRGDTQNSRLRVGVLQNTTTREHIRTSIWPNITRELSGVGFRFEDFDLVEATTHWESKALFDQKKIDVYIADREILIAIRKIENDPELIVSSRYFSVEPYALFTRNDDLELLYVANKTLRDLYLEEDKRQNIRGILRENFPGQILSSTLLQLFRLQRILD